MTTQLLKLKNKTQNILFILRKKYKLQVSGESYCERSGGKHTDDDCAFCTSPDIYNLNTGCFFISNALVLLLFKTTSTCKQYV